MHSSQKDSICTRNNSSTSTTLLPPKTSILRQSSICSTGFTKSRETIQNSSSKRHVHFGYLEEILYNESEEDLLEIENKNFLTTTIKNLETDDVTTPTTVQRRTAELSTPYSSTLDLSTIDLIRKTSIKSFNKSKLSEQQQKLPNKEAIIVAPVLEKKSVINVLRFYKGTKSLLESLSGCGHLRHSSQINFS